MSFPQGVFSVYFPDDNISAVFPSRKASDKYWRQLQETIHQEHSKTTPPPYRICSRIFSAPLLTSGTLPTHQPSGAALHHGSTTDLRPDNVNGESYYIRSAIQPNLFWFYNNNHIEISSVYKTKFTIRRKTPLPFKCRPEDNILIDEDDIHIFVATPEWKDDGPDILIVRDTRKLLVPASALRLSGRRGTDILEAATFRFGMFDRGFGVLDAKSWEGKEVFAGTRVNGGERWEFVQ